MVAAVSIFAPHPAAGLIPVVSPDSEPAPASAVQRASGEARLRSMVQQHFDFIWRSLRALGLSAASADDACQQVFIIASRKLELIAAGSERSFLFATARGVAANARRANIRNREDADERALEGEIDRAPDPEQVATRNEAKRLLEMILAGMAEDVRTVFVLFELEGMTTAEIAELLALPMGTVASRLRRAREHFEAETARVQAQASRVHAGDGGQRGGGNR
jgi:RNA polymerase sigma-70 factor (ECF subfamily)